jgi:hypothetical protein
MFTAVVTKDPSSTENSEALKDPSRIENLIASEFIKLRTPSLF